MKRTFLTSVLLLGILLAAVVSQAQVVAQAATGTPPFGSFGGGPFDTVNLGNLNFSFGVPILHKAGRGMPFNYDLTFNSSVWTVASVSGTTTWQPATNYGWNFTTPNYAYGYISYKLITSYTQPCNPPNNMNPIYIEIYGFWSYVDKNGSHPFNVSTSNYLGGCNITAPPNTATAIATDGSGFTIKLVGSGGTIYGADGKIVNTSPGSGVTTDANGNEISQSTNTTMQITDTLGQTALTIQGTNPVLLQYTAPSASTAQYKINYVTKNVKTAFQCSGVADTTINNVSLIGSITLPDNSSTYTFTYEDTPGFTGYTTARLKQVTLPTGATIGYTYTGTNGGISCADGTAIGLTRTVTPGGLWTYSRSNISGNQWQTTVTSPPDPANTGSASDVTVITFSREPVNYSGAASFYETQRQIYQGASTLLLTKINCYNGNYATCATANVSSPITQLDAYTQLPNNSTALSETAYNSYGLPTETKAFDYGVALGAAPTTNPIQDTVVSYGSWNGTNCVALNGVVSLPCQVTVKDGSGTVVSQSSYSYDETTPTATSGTPQHTSVTGSRGNLTTLATKVNGTLTLYRKFTYYDTGNVSTATDLGTSSSGGSNTTTYTYGTGSCGNSFLTSTSEPLGLSRTNTWDCVGGVMNSVTNENGNITTTYFAQASTYGSPDTLYWRPYAATDPLSNPTKFTYPSLTASESNLTFNSSHSVVDARTKVDVFGRPIVTQRQQGFGLSTYDSVETDYDVFGRAYKAVLPYSANADSLCSGTCPGTTVSYDAIGRTTSVTDGGSPNPGTISYSYINNDVYQSLGPGVTGENTKRKQLEYDSLGRLTSVCEVTSASGSATCGQTGNSGVIGYWTRYKYDARGLLVGVCQNTTQSLATDCIASPSTGQETRTFTFDQLGRMLTESNPETGTVTYVYDSWDSACGAYASVGDLVEKKDAMNPANVTCMKYDALHRLIQTTYPSGANASATPTKCLVYASPSSAVTVNSQTMQNAYLAVAEAYTTSANSCPSTPSGQTVDEGFSYTARGEVSDVWQKTPDSGGWHHVNATYWANGTLNVLNGGTNQLSGLPATTYGWSDGSGVDGEGRITKVMAATGQNPVTCTTAPCVTYNTAGQLTAITFGSNDNDAYQYDGNTGRMTQYKLNMGSGPQSVTGALTWNPNGSLQKLVLTDQINTGNSQTCKFGDPGNSIAGYDDLGRLIKADCASIWAQTFGFDPFGNLKKTGSAQFLPTYTGEAGAGPPTNQYNQITGGPSGKSNYYDSNGNLISDQVSGSGHTYGWDADGNMWNVDASTVSVIYDALDRAIEITKGSTHTEVVYGPYGMKLALMNGQSLVSAFVPLPAGTAVYNNSGLAYYRHPDHLGSSRLATTPSRTNSYDVAYAPYGEDYNGSGTTADLNFTRQNQDTVTGGWSNNLYDFLMREYRTAHGRWISPDPAGLGAVDPTSPQSWNRYSYVVNNPLALVDPRGLCWQVTYVPQANGKVDESNVVKETKLYPGPCQGVPCPGGAWSLSSLGYFCYMPTVIGGQNGSQLGSGQPGAKLAVLLDKLANCPQGAKMAQDLARFWDTRRLTIGDLGSLGDGKTSYFGNITIDGTTGINVPALGHEWWHTVQMDTFLREGGWANWSGAWIVNGWYGIFKGTNVGPLDNEAEAVGQWISSKCGIP